MEKVEIIICTENGYLESLSKLLVYSLRTFGGRFKDIPVYSYSPRKNRKISKDTISFFEQNQVEYIDLDLNTKFENYHFANKVESACHRERNTKADILVWLDSDIFFLNEPNEFTNFEGADVMLRPEDFVAMGTAHPEDKNALYWKKLYELLNVKVQRKVFTTVTHKEILEYYQAGHIITKTSNSLFAKWKENYSRVMDYGLEPLSVADQTVISATVSQMELKVKQVHKGYNAPLNFNKKHNKYSLQDFAELVTVHYHKTFSHNYAHPVVNEFLKTDVKGQLLNSKLKEFEVIVKGNYAEQIAYKLKRKIKAQLKRFV